VKRGVILALWVVSILIGAHIVHSTTIVSSLSTNRLLLVDFVQRILVVLSLVFMVWHLIFVKNKKKLLFSNVNLFLVVLGISVFMFLNMYALYLTKGLIDPFVVFTDFCALCKTRLDFYVNFMRIAFWVVGVYFISVIFKNDEVVKIKKMLFAVLGYIVVVLLMLQVLLPYSSFG